MKVKIKKTKGELTAQYYNAKDVHAFRFAALEYIAQMANKSLTFFVDTNNSAGKIPTVDIIELLEGCCEEYMMESTLETGRMLYGISSFLKGSRKPEMTEKLIAVKMNKDRLSKEIYDGFLKCYDYGIGLDCRLSTEEMLKKYAEGCGALLFNKEVLAETFYDSILFYRLRTDCPDSGFENHLGAIGK